MFEFQSGCRAAYSTETSLIHLFECETKLDRGNYIGLFLHYLQIYERLSVNFIVLPGELLSPGSLDAMDDVAVGEEAGASSSSAGADSDDSLPQPAPIPLVESIDEALVPDIIAGTTGTSSVFQSAWVFSVLHTAHNTTQLTQPFWAILAFALF